MNSMGSRVAAAGRQLMRPNTAHVSIAAMLRDRVRRADRRTGHAASCGMSLSNSVMSVTDVADVADRVLI